MIDDRARQAHIPIVLEMDVEIEQGVDGARLAYELRSTSEAFEPHRLRIRGGSLKRSLESYRNEVVQRLKRLRTGRDFDGSSLSSADVEESIDNLGRKLYRELFPSQLRHAYRRFRNTVNTIQITSAEPWIPWEWIKPYDDEDPSDIIDDDFLCMRFELTRWLASARSAPQQIPVRKLACIEAGRVPEQRVLRQAVQEAEKVRELARVCKVEDVSPAEATQGTLKQVLSRGDVGLLHLVGHGSYKPADPSESGFRLSDGTQFRVESLEGPLAAQVGKGRPMVFFNSCQAARQGLSLTGLEGWVNAWVANCSCGGFIGPQWRIHDSSACLFAEAFYQGLRVGETFACAIRKARFRLRKERPRLPDWLAYCLYAHPNGGLRVPIHEKDSLITFGGLHHE